MFRNKTGMRGLVVIRLWDELGSLKTEQIVENLITTAGDEYYAKKSAHLVAPASLNYTTVVNGMKLGTNTSVPTKSGSASALGSYVSGSNVAFMSTFPQLQDLSGDTGWNILYYSQWAPGVATNSALTEAVIVTDRTVNATSTAANTISRVTFSAVNKTAADTLEISWAHTFLGA